MYERYEQGLSLFVHRLHGVLPSHLCLRRLHSIHTQQELQWTYGISLPSHAFGFLEILPATTGDCELLACKKGLVKQADK